MKTTLLISFTFFTFFYFSQKSNHSTREKSLPSIELKDMKGKTVNISELGLDGPIVISFWATWCSPCKKELNTINEIYQDWQFQTVKLTL